MTTETSYSLEKQFRISLKVCKLMSSTQNSFSIINEKYYYLFLFILRKWIFSQCEPRTHRWVVGAESSPGVFLPDDLQDPSDHVPHRGLRGLSGRHSPALFSDYFHQITWNKIQLLFISPSVLLKCLVQKYSYFSRIL